MRTPNAWITDEQAIDYGEKMSPNAERVARSAKAAGVVGTIAAVITLTFSLGVFATAILPALYPLALTGIVASVVTVPISIVAGATALVLGFAARNGADSAAARRGVALGCLTFATLAAILFLHNVLGSYLA